MDAEQRAFLLELAKLGPATANAVANILNAPEVVAQFHGVTIVKDRRRAQRFVDFTHPRDE